MNLVNFIRMLKQHILLLIIPPIVVLPVVFLLLQNTPQVFKTHLIISMGLTGGGIPLSSEVSRFASFTRTMNLLELAKSRSVFEVVGYQLLYHDLTHDRPFRRVSATNSEITPQQEARAKAILKTMFVEKDSINLSREQFILLQQLIDDKEYSFRDLRAKFKIHRIDESDFLNLVFEAEKPELVAYVLNTIADVLIEKYRLLMSGESTRSRRFFEDLVKKSLDTLRAREKEMQQFKEQNNIIHLNEQITSIIDQINDFERLRDENMQLIETLKASIWKIQSQLSSSGHVLETSQLIMTNNRVIELTEQIKRMEKDYLQRKYEMNQTELSNLELKLTEKHEQLDQQVYKLWLGQYVDPQVQRQELATKLINNRIELEVARAKEKVIADRIASLTSKSAIYSPLEAENASLTRAINIAEQEYLELRGKLNLARTNESNSLSTINLKVVEPAIAPRKPTDIGKKKLMALAGIGSLIISLIIIIVIEYFDFSIRTVTDVEKIIGNSLLGGLPLISPDIQTFLKDPFNSDYRVVTEILRQLRDKIIIEHGNQKTITIISARQGDGKSHFVAMFASVLARANIRTLVVDCNFRAPSLDHYFEISTNCYFQDILTARIPLTQGVQKTYHENLDLICCTDGAESPLEVANAKRLNDVINELKQKYDLILFDTPALNEFADAREIISNTDACIWIVSAGRIFNEAAERNLVSVKNYDCKFLGVILNRVEPDQLKIFRDEISI